MKQSFSFNTDERLNVKSWDGFIADLTQKSPASVIGHKYYEIIPRIFIGDDDALLRSLEDNEKLELNGYSFKCFYGDFKSDIIIEPHKAASGGLAEIKVTISSISECPISQKLRDSQKLIDIGKTASSLAHGVRNPLNAIKGAVVYLREKYSTEPTLIEFTKIMEDEILRLDNFISTFLSGTAVKTEEAGVDINSLMRKIGVATTLQAYSCNVKVAYEYGKVPELNIDAFQLEQAVLNVINNAMEAMNGGGLLTIRTGLERRSEKDFVVITISDSGSGFPGITTSGKKRPSGADGRGFGLFITREALKCYGGYLEIASQREKGTDVRLCLPVAENAGSGV